MFCPKCRSLHVYIIRETLEKNKYTCGRCGIILNRKRKNPLPSPQTISYTKYKVIVTFYEVKTNKEAQV